MPFGRCNPDTGVEEDRIIVGAEWKGKSEFTRNLQYIVETGNRNPPDDALEPSVINDELI